MSLIIVKAITIIIKSTAKPIIAWLTHYNKMMLKESTHKELDLIKNKLNVIGQSYNYYLTKFNRKVLKLSNKDPIRLLSEEKGIEKGVEFVSELVLYAIIIGIPVWELLKASEEKKMAKLNEDSRIKKIESTSNAIWEENKKLHLKVDKQLKQKIDRVRSLV